MISNKVLCYYLCMEKINVFFEDSPLTSALFADTEHVWDALKILKSFIGDSIRPNVQYIKRKGTTVTEAVTLDNGAYVHEGVILMDNDIEIGPDAVIEPGALIKGPAIIGAGTEVRQGAYIRGNVVSGPQCVIGHTTEIKHSALLGETKAGHFNYIGDSLLGAVNLGAGTKLANLKITDSEVRVNIDGNFHPTGLRKFGAVMGDGCQTGCNSTTMPGTILEKNVLVYPNCAVSGYHESSTIVRLKQNIEVREQKRW